MLQCKIVSDHSALELSCSSVFCQRKATQWDSIICILQALVDGGDRDQPVGDGFAALACLKDFPVLE